MAWLRCSSPEKHPTGASLVFWASQGVCGCDTLLFFIGTKGQNRSSSPAPDAGAVLGVHGQCPPRGPGVTGLLGLASVPV